MIGNEAEEVALGGESFGGDGGAGDCGGTTIVGLKGVGVCVLGIERNVMWEKSYRH